MVRLRSIWLPSLLAAAALVAGCGSSSGSSSSSSPTGSTASTQTSSTPSGTTPTPSDSASAIERCRTGVKSLPHLRQSTRSRLEDLCAHAHDNPEATRKAAVEACREIVNASPLPPGPAKERALRTCANAGGSKSGK